MAIMKKPNDTVFQKTLAFSDFWDFLKNLSLGAGFLLITVGTDGAGLTQFLAHPLASSHPYAGVHR